MKQAPAAPITIYDVTTDEFREATQADVDLAQHRVFALCAYLRAHFLRADFNQWCDTVGIDFTASRTAGGDIAPFLFERP